MSDSFCPSASSTSSPVRHHVAVYLTSDASCYQAVDTACQQARAQNAEFSAFYVDTGSGRHSRSEEAGNLQKITDYASSLGAHIDVISGSSPVYLVGEYCKSHHVDLLVMNRPSTQRGLRRIIPTFAQQVSRIIPETRLLTVPGTMTIHFRHLESEKMDLPTALREFFRVILIVLVTTAICVGLDRFGVEEFTLAQIVVIGVLLCSVNTNSWIWALLSAAISVVLFIFLFAEPRYALFYTQPKLTLAFLMTFISSLIGGFIGTRLHRESMRSLRSSWGTQVLLDTTHLLQNCDTSEQIISTVCRKLAAVTEKNVVYYPCVDEILEEPLLFPFNPASSVSQDELNSELLAAKTAVRQKTATGSKTQLYPDSAYRYFPWASDSAVYGVVGIRLDQETLSPLELMILNNIVAEGVLSLEGKLKGQALQEMQVKAESDLLRSNLLKALSHDIRTPLTSIIGNVACLQPAVEMLSGDYGDILKAVQDDSLNLYNMVENLLTAARLDNNSVAVRPHPELLSDVVEAGMDYPSRANKTHPIDLEESEDLLMINMDPSLIAQVVSNMVLNAIHHTPDGTPIHIRTYQDGDEAVVEVADTGHGIPDATKERIFDIFYTGEAPSYDSSHYLGLGLYLCREIIAAHQGTISVRDNEPQGCIFSFRLPLLELH